MKSAPAFKHQQSYHCKWPDLFQCCHGAPPPQRPAPNTAWPMPVMLLFTSLLKEKEISQPQSPYNHHCSHTTQVPELSHNPTLHLPFSASPRPCRWEGAWAINYSATHASVTTAPATSSGVLVAVSPAGDPLWHPIQAVLSRATSGTTRLSWDSCASNLLGRQPQREGVRKNSGDWNRKEGKAKTRMHDQLNSICQNFLFYSRIKTEKHLLPTPVLH